MKNESPCAKVNQKVRLLQFFTTLPLFFHRTLIENIRNKYRNAQGEKERQIITKVIKYVTGYTYQQMRNRKIWNYHVHSYERDDVTGKKQTITLKKTKTQF